MQKKRTGDEANFRASPSKKLDETLTSHLLTMHLGQECSKASALGVIQGHQGTRLGGRAQGGTGGGGGGGGIYHCKSFPAMGMQLSTPVQETESCMPTGCHNNTKVLI